MEERPVLVTAAIIVRDGRVLLDRRKASSRFEPSRWEFPGGKVDFGESPQDSLRRELMEELGVTVEVGSLFHLISHVYGSGGNRRHVVILFFECRLTEGEPSPLEGGEVAWFDRSELVNVDIVEADTPLVWMLLPRISRGTA